MIPALRRMTSSRPLLVLAVAALFAIACLAVLPNLLSLACPQPVRLSLSVFMEAPDTPSVFEVYVNQDFHHPLRVEQSVPVSRRYSFAGLPDQLTHLRLNPLDTAGVEFRLHDLEIVAHGGASEAGAVIYRFDLSQISRWQISGAEWQPATQSFLSTNSDPTLLVPVDLDLAPLIPRPALSLASARVLTAAAILILTAMLSAIGLVFPTLVARTRERPERATIYLATVALVAFAALAYAQIEAGRKMPSYQAQFSAMVDKPYSSAHLYVNANWSAPWLADISRPDGRTEFSNIPASPRQLRFDLAAATGATVELGPVRFFAIFDDAPPYKLAMLPVTTLTAWSISGMHAEGKTNRFVADTPMPIMSGSLNLDLSTMLPPSAPLPWTWHLARAVAAVTVGLAALLLPLAATHYFRRVPSAAGTAAIIALAVLGWLATLLSSFPGHWVFDQFYVLNEFLGNAVSDLQPPFFAWLWLKTINMTAALGGTRLAQISTLLILQTTVFWAVAAMLALSFSRRWLGMVLLVNMAALPSVLSYLGDIGKDGQATTALFEATALIFLAGRRRSWPMLLVALLPLWQAFVVRSNGFIAVLPLCFYWSLTLGMLMPRFGPVKGTLPVGIAARLRWTGAAMGLFALLLAGTAAFQSSVVVRKCCLGAPGALTLIHDLMGISLRVGENMVPPFLYTKPDYSLADIRSTYYPTDNLNLTGLRGVLPPEEQREIFTHWRRAVTAHPIAYLGHRWEVLRYFTGLSGEPNRYAMFTGQTIAEANWVTVESKTLFAGLKDVPSTLVTIRNKVFLTWALARDTVIFRSYAYVLVGGLAFMLLWRRGGGMFTVLATYAGVSAAIYYFSHFPLTSSASFRYISWSVMAVPLVALCLAEDVLAADEVAGRRRVLRYVLTATAAVIVAEALRLTLASHL